MEHRGLPHSFRLTLAEDGLLKQLVQIHEARSESQYMRRLLLTQGELYSCDYVPKIDGQSAFAFVPRLHSWAPLERLVRAHVQAEKGAGGEPPAWTAALDKPTNDENEAMDAPQVCCGNPLPVIVGTLFGCAQCEQHLPIAGALALLKWRAKRFERTNKPLHDELMRQIEAIEHIEKLERVNPLIRKARTNLAALCQAPVLVEPPQSDDDSVDEWPFVDKHGAFWEVLSILARNAALTTKQISSLLSKDELNVESAVDMGVDDGWMTHIGDNVAITQRGRKFLLCTTERGGGYRRWEEMDIVWRRILEMLAPGKPITTEAIADNLSEHEDIVYGVLQLSETWEWVQSRDGFVWELAEWLRPLKRVTQDVLSLKWCERQKDYYLPGGEKTNVDAVKQSLVKLQSMYEEVAGPVPSTDSHVAAFAPKTQKAKPPPKSKKAVAKKKVAGSTTKALVLRCKLKGARKALVHVVAKCNPLTTTAWHAVCGELLEPMGYPPKNGVPCRACESLKDDRQPLLEEDLPLIGGWVRLWDEKHDLAHTRRKNPFWGSEHVAVCNVVLQDEAKNGASSKWKLAPDHVRDCPKCASLREKTLTAGARKAVAA